MTRFRWIASAVASLVVASCLALTWSSPAMALAGTTHFGLGWSQSCVIESAGAAYCWGQNNSGQLGDGTNTDSVVPVLVSGSHTFTELSAGGYFSCGIVTNGDAYCWGTNGYGQLGDGTTNGSNVPVLVTGSHTFSSISSGYSHTCALDTGGTVYCWGLNNEGELGDGTTTESHSPVAVSGTYKSVAVGFDNTCAITTSDAAYCWGANPTGKLGDGTTTERHVPTAVTGGLTFTSIALGDTHTCALRPSGAAYCWGNDGQGELGDNSFATQTSPVAVLGGLTFRSITAGYQSACGLTIAYDAYCWGGNSYGQLGTGDNNGQMTPALVPGGYKWLAIATTATNPVTCGTTNGGSVFCTGYGGDGALGNNDRNDRNSMTEVWLYVGSATITVAAVVDPSFSFTVAGRSSVCNGQSGTNFQAASTATSVGLGHISAGTVAGGAQDLTIATNASNGFMIYVRTSGTTPNALRDGAGHSIADVVGTSASPGAAPVAGTAGFGYTSSDTSTAFTSNTWAKLTNSNDSVAIGSPGTMSKSECVGYEVAVATTTPASAYSVNVIYTAVPSF